MKVANVVFVLTIFSVNAGVLGRFAPATNVASSSAVDIIEQNVPCDCRDEAVSPNCNCPNPACVAEKVVVVSSPVEDVVSVGPDLVIAGQKEDVKKIEDDIEKNKPGTFEAEVASDGSIHVTKHGDDVHVSDDIVIVTPETAKIEAAVKEDKKHMIMNLIIKIATSLKVHAALYGNKDQVNFLEFIQFHLGGVFDPEDVFEIAEELKLICNALLTNPVITEEAGFDLIIILDDLSYILRQPEVVVVGTVFPEYHPTTEKDGTEVVSEAPDAVVVLPDSVIVVSEDPGVYPDSGAVIHQEEIHVDELPIPEVPTPVEDGDSVVVIIPEEKETILVPEREIMAEIELLPLVKNLFNEILDCPCVKGIFFKFMTATLNQCATISQV